MNDNASLYFDDFTVGRRFVSGTRLVDAGEIKEFARQFDPQPFHLDEEAAKDTFFKGLAASGWHTMAMSMKLMVEGGLPVAGGIIGAGGEINWPQATRPGDVLQVFSEVIEAKPSRSRPGWGWLKVRTRTLNQNGEVVQSYVGNLIARRRGA